MRFAVLFVCGVLFSTTVQIRAQVDQRCPGTALDRGPVVISGRDQLKKVIHAQGYSGRFNFRATITEDGTVRDPVIMYPASMKDAQTVRTSIESMRFCPAVKYSRYASVNVNFDIEVK
jgi:hypothetical protein